MKPPTNNLPPCAYQPYTYDGPSRDAVLAKRKRYVNPAVFT